MEINPNIRTGGVARPTSQQPVTPRSISSADTAAFSGAETVRGSLSQVPNARPEQVARARELIQDIEYPPLDTIKRIAVLLAMSLDEENN